jgi:choline dehydrogenase
MVRTALFLGLASQFLLASAIPTRNATYDYVVIGGGTSGLAIAARLAEDPDVSVAVIEAGGYYEVDSGQVSIVPGLAPAANTGTDPSDDNLLIDWNFDMQPLRVGILQMID